MHDEGLPGSTAKANSEGSTPVDDPELQEDFRAVYAEMVRLRAALRLIAEGSCDCHGYYRCNDCPARLVRIAEEALDEASGFGVSSGQTTKANKETPK
jgi:hypothetical protein